MRHKQLIPAILLAMAPWAATAQDTTAPTEAHVPETAAYSAPAPAAEAPKSDLPDWVEKLPKVSGFAQVRYSRFATPEKATLHEASKFELPNIRLAVGSRKPWDTVIGDIGYKAEIDVASGLKVKDVYVEVMPRKYIGLRVGQFKTPFLFAGLVSETKLQTIDNALAKKTLGYGRDVGAQLQGSTDIVKDKLAVNYALGMFNGEGEGAWAAPKESAYLIGNVNDKFLYAGRVALDILGGTDMDEADLIGKCKQWVNTGDECTDKRTLRATVGGGLVRNKHNAMSDKKPEWGGDETRWAVDGHVKYYGLSLSGEYGQGTLVPDTGADINRAAYFTQLGYAPGLLPWLEVVGRHEYSDANTDAKANDGKLQGIYRESVGLNLYAMGHNAKLMFDYAIYNGSEDDKAGLRKAVAANADRFRVQMHVGF